MSYKGNECENCTEAKICIDHLIEMVSWEVEEKTKELEQLKQEKENAEYAGKIKT